MADRVESFELLVPAGTAKAAARQWDVSFQRGIVRELEIVIPDGHCGLTGIQIAQAHQPMIPLTKGQWIISNDEVIRWPLADFIDSGNWQAFTYNTDIYDHHFWVRFLIDKTGKRVGVAEGLGFYTGTPVAVGGGEAPEAAGGGGAGEAGGGEAAPPETPEAPGEAPAPGPEPEPAPGPGPEPPPEEAPPAEAPPPEQAPPSEAGEAPEAAAAPEAEAQPAPVAEPPQGLTVAEQIAYYQHEIPRLEKLAKAVARQIRVHPHSPAVPDWRTIHKAYLDAIAKMRSDIARLRKLPPESIAPTKHFKGPRHALPAKAAEKIIKHPPKPKPRAGVAERKPASKRRHKR